MRYLAALFLISFSVPAHSAVVPFGQGTPKFKKAVHGDPVPPQGWQLTAGKAEDLRAWVPRDGEKAFALRDGVTVSTKLPIPALGEKEARAKGAWAGLVTVDLLGTPSGEESAVKLRVLDPESGEVLADAEATSSGKAPRAPRAGWRISATSQQPGHDAAKAFDGDPASFWHSKWGAGQKKHPHAFTLDFGAAKTIEGLSYLPRQNGSNNGTVTKYRIELSDDGSKWRTAAEGEFTYPKGDRSKSTVRFDAPKKARAIRLVSLAEKSGGPFASAAEITPLGADFEKPEPEAKPAPTPIHRAYALIPSDAFTSLIGKELQIEISCGKKTPVVVGKVDVCRLHEAPSKKLFGRSNGGLGPDKLGCGGLGFDALTEHRQRALSLMAVYPDSPAEAAGLKKGDIIVEVAGEPLPENDLAPGWRWFEQSHEATLGRAIQSAIADSGILALTLLRDGKPHAIDFAIVQPGALTTLAASNPAAAALRGDLIAYLERTQRQDGSWGGNPIRTSLAALALLANGEQTHAARVKNAVDWMLERYPDAENFGNLGFWFCGYAGILYGEYHLATGDPRVLGRMEAMLDWPMTGMHTSKWGMPALGHGPSGLPYGQKSLVAPAIHLLVFESLAQRCGLKSRIWETLEPYMEHSWSDPAKDGHGAMGYNASYRDLGEFWSRSGLFAVASKVRGERTDMATAMAKVMRERHPWIRNSHAYGEPGGAMGLLGLHAVDPAAYREVLDAYSWWFHLAWQPGYGLKFTTPHMGAPYMGEDELLAAAYGLALNADRRSLAITGSKRRNWLDASALPTRPSEVQMRRDREGRVYLAAKIPGPSIRFTTDGSEPGPESSLYREPIGLPHGGVIKARAEGGEVSEREFGLANGGWKITAASGHQDPPTAVGRASYAIDGDPKRCWFADVGEGATGFPHGLTIDLGAPAQVARIKLHFFKAAAAPDSVKVLAGDKEVAAETWKEFASSQEITLPAGTETAQLRFEFTAADAEQKGGLVIREIELFR